MAAVKFGIIGDSTTIGLVNIARIKVGFPDDGAGPTVIVSTSALLWKVIGGG